MGEIPSKVWELVKARVPESLREGAARQIEEILDRGLPNELEFERKERETAEQFDAIMERLAAIEAKLDNPLMQVEPPARYAQQLRLECAGLARGDPEHAAMIYAFVVGS